MQTTTKLFRGISAIAIGFTLFVAVLSIAGVTFTGWYPGIFVLWLIALIPLASGLYLKKLQERPDNIRKNYYRTFIVINVLVIIVTLWMSWVIVHDRILQDCC